jgi:hypothetical protein
MVEPPRPIVGEFKLVRLAWISWNRVALGQSCRRMMGRLG